MTKKYTIDATGKIIGRLASDVAMLLMGKRDPAYRPNVVSDVLVQVTNLSKARVTGTKTTTKLYWRFSGYPGGLKNKTLGSFWEKDPVGFFEHVVGGMLPKNRLRSTMLKRLTITA
ncbi:MAG: 50S ribosomal protein L13 [bacterium]|nr:50S ribosomal protein L13 [bacterium]MDO8581592.1 50S ribosomal protein L13 [bacterium]